MSTDDENRLAKLAGLGFGAPYIAKEFQENECWVHRQATRLGITLPRGRNVYPNYRSRVEELTALEAVDYLLNLVENLIPTHDEARMQEVLQHGFTRQESRVVLGLIDSSDGTISRGDAYSLILLHSNDVNDPPSTQAVDMVLSRVRKKLAGLDWGLEIETIRGVGYRLHKPEGFEVPA